jgi:2-polyprenyl-3-methyl-5-hydroxy-6-metoxy-1,4-benzoquinol methylase
MNYRFVESCPVCNDKSFSDFIICKDYFSSLETYGLKRCVGCGFLFTQNVPTEDKIGKYYESPNYISHTDTKKGIVNYLYHFARQFMLQKKCSLVSKVSGLKSGSLLDYGSGTGYFLNAMSQKGWQTLGIEKSDVGREFSKSEFGITIQEPSYLASIEAESYDVISLWHVLEHIEDLNAFMQELIRILKPSGTLVIAVPNSESYDAIHYGKFWAAYDVPRHLWHFSPDTVSLLAKKHLLKIIDLKGMPFDAFYISMMSEINKRANFTFLRGVIGGLIATIQSCTQVTKQSSIIYILKKDN